MKFYNYGLRINFANEHFKPRIEPDYRDETVFPLDHTLILFGIDFLGIKKIKKIFPDAADIMDIDESNCKIRFTDRRKARQAILSNVRKESLTRLKVEEEDENEDEMLSELGINLEKSEHLPPKGTHF